MPFPSEWMRTFQTRSNVPLRSCAAARMQPYRFYCSFKKVGFRRGGASRPLRPESNILRLQLTSGCKAGWIFHRVYLVRGVQPSSHGRYLSVRPTTLTVRGQLDGKTTACVALAAYAQGRAI